MENEETYFEEKLASAIQMCGDHYIVGYSRPKTVFSRLYPFTTENISGYLDFFDLKDQSLLTVGSSSDQVMNAIMKGCHDITLVDICPYAKEYFYLKKAGMMELNFEEFFHFFCYKDYPKFCRDNKEVFQKELYEKMKRTLRLLDYESYLFWDELFSTFSHEDIRTQMFELDEERSKQLRHMNLYLKDEKTYCEAKQQVSTFHPKFITGDLFHLKLNKQYDNIFLSNIAAYYELGQMKELFHSLTEHLTDQGKMLFAYLYDTKRDTPYQEDWDPIYNLENVFQMFPVELFNFQGVKGIRFEEDIPDAILVYQKKNTKRK